MRCEVKSGGPMLGVMAAVIVLFLVGFFFPSSLHSLRVCVHAYMWDLFFFYIVMQCSIWPWEEHVPEGYRERAEWMCDHFNLCVILDCTTSYLTTEQLSQAVRTLSIQLFQFHAYIHCRLQGWSTAGREKQVTFLFKKKKKIIIKL